MKMRKLQRQNVIIVYLLMTFSATITPTYGQTTFDEPASVFEEDNGDGAPYNTAPTTTEANNETETELGLVQFDMPTSLDPYFRIVNSDISGDN